ncbi:aromatic amino acid transport family protein [Acaryochloris sp. IP29b_bin.137]|uniref:amino acid permease n=1 Tax=Acaryochloris sp. IP29b_bin.137 TaxID=2969217 RepID=UPI00261E0245|nr:aromatic amino acid transport family protein [Acaryochloris sp. IP29b_bin.137]
MQFDDRLFSQLDVADAQFKRAPDQRVSAIALVAGTTVGAGILALPAITQPAGFLPSTCMLIVVWVYALVAALLLAEVNVRCMRRSGQPNIGLLRMVESTLGPSIANVSGGAYLFLHYALLVAYMAQGGDILASAMAHIPGVNAPDWAGPTLFALVFGGLLYGGSEKLVARFNSTFVAIVITTFMVLLVLSGSHIDPGELIHQNWPAISPAVSIMLVALFYHNIVPVVTTQLEGDLSKIRQSIVVGSVIPLLMFLVWNAVILGSIGGLSSLSPGSERVDPLELLRNNTNLPGLGLVVSVFSEFAIATSFIGFTYGLLDFLMDALKVRELNADNRLPFYSVIFLPALGLSTLNPNIFFTALDYAGAFSISILGGILPAVMAWKLRYRSATIDLPSRTLVPGGRATLTMMVILAIGVIGIQLLTMVTA